MPENILVAVAWPYANADIHVGNLAGSYLPADIYARYHRLAGNRVLMVSGSDSHGTPVTVKADQLGKPPREVFEAYHRSFLHTFIQLGLSYDLFTHTDTENHHRVAQDMFLCLLHHGYLYRQKQLVMYSPVSNRFLPDRYVEGTCPICGYPDARGDQCDHCGNLLDAIQLINPRSKIDGSRPEPRETEHFFLDLAKLAPRIGAWLNENKEHWKPNVINFARNQVREGLHGRPITRDIDWGIPVPLPGWEGKCLYVWFEAVIGYLSASIEWSINHGQPDAWKAWWYDPAARTVYFIGKDNIPFHAIIWPGELLGCERLYEDDPSKRLNLPYDVPANEFMNLEGQKISGSRNWAVWANDFLSRYDPDPLRYYLTAVMPETRDVDFAWDDFLRRNNDELVATWGNLAHRALTFAYKHFDQRVPQPGELDEADRALLAQLEAAFAPIGALYDGCKFRAALSQAMDLATAVNRYLDYKAPWAQIKTDRAAAATTLYVTLRAIDSLRVLLAPVLPFSTQALHEMLGYDGDTLGEQRIETLREPGGKEHLALTYDGSKLALRWQPSQLPPGQPLRPPRPLFKKLDEHIVAEERARIGQPR